MRSSESKGDTVFIFGAVKLIFVISLVLFISILTCSHDLTKLFEVSNLHVNLFLCNIDLQQHITLDRCRKVLQESITIEKSV